MSNTWINYPDKYGQQHRFELTDAEEELLDLAFDWFYGDLFEQSCAEWGFAPPSQERINKFYKNCL